MSTTIQAEVPDLLWQQAQAYVHQGWAENIESLLSESLRRYMESHQTAPAEFERRFFENLKSVE